jgi:hypothetical protein
MDFITEGTEPPQSPVFCRLRPAKNAPKFLKWTGIGTGCDFKSYCRKPDLYCRIGDI